MPRRLFLALCALLGLAATAGASEHARGYAQAVLDEFGVSGATVSVAGGTVTVRADGLSMSERDGLERAIRRAPDAETVRFEPGLSPEGGRGLHWLPRRALFEPLMADPRWPRLSGTMTRYSDNGDGLGRVWSGNFGAAPPLLGWDGRHGGQWQLGAQAAVFTLWDMETLSNDHLNADYLVGFPLFYRRGRFSAMARLYHVSTHLGDEYMLTHPNVPRVNLSYEAVDAVLSWQADDRLRVYGGAGQMIRRDPKDTAPGSLQAGAEYQHRRAYGTWRLRPVLAVDLQKHAKSGWGSTDLSARAGVSMEHRTFASRRALLAFEYYRGKDPNGQFFRRAVQHVGLGLSVYY
jgi:hypothetical protein